MTSTKRLNKTRNRSLLSSAIAIHLAALVVAIVTNNPMESLARSTSGDAPIEKAQSNTDDAATSDDTSVLETSYSGSDFDDWVNDLPGNYELNEEAEELRSHVNQPLQDSLDEAEDFGLDTQQIDSEKFDSDQPFSTAN